MELTKKDIKEVFSRTDPYYSFRYNDFQTISSRLKKWRELNHVSQKEMATFLYNHRKFMGFEDDWLSEDEKKELVDTTDFSCPDHEIHLLRERKKERRITTLMRAYHTWESQETNSFSVDTSFSLVNLRILKKILNCDYQFLFCEIDTPHRMTDNIANETGLSVSTVEKLLSLDKSYLLNAKDTVASRYAYNILTALNLIIADDDLMAYLSYYLSYYWIPEDTDFSGSPTHFQPYSTSSITVKRPITGIPTENAHWESEKYNMLSEELHTVFTLTLAGKLSRIQNNRPDNQKILPTGNASCNLTPIAEDGDLFATRLRKLRAYKQVSQRTVATYIYNYRKDHDLKKTNKGTPYLPEESSVLRTYQNWETITSPKETRLSLTDLYILKKYFGCDYEYLLGEINTLIIPDQTLYASLGLSEENLCKLRNYTKLYKEQPPKTSAIPVYAGNILSAIDLIVSDDELLSYLAYYLSDADYYVQMSGCDILKPEPIIGQPDPLMEAYSKNLFPENTDMRNVFLPEILKHFRLLQKRNTNNKQPIINRFK